MVRPVHPVSEMSTASSSSVSGVRGSDDVQLIEPASMELPRLTRCVRRRQIDVSSGRSVRASSPAWPSLVVRLVIVLPFPRRPRGRHPAGLPAQ